MKPQLGISHLEAIPAEVFDEFVEEVSSNGADIEVRTHGGVFAGIEWLMPTAIILFISRAYFDAIFSELGKDHYKVLKRAVKGLHRRANGFRITQTGSPGKLADKQIYSRAFSIMVAVVDDLTLKFLIQPNLREADAETALFAFLDLIESIADRSISQETLERLETGRISGRTLLLAYDFDEGAIVPLDPFPKAPSD